MVTAGLVLGVESPVTFLTTATSDRARQVTWPEQQLPWPTLWSSTALVLMQDSSCGPIFSSENKGSTLGAPHIWGFYDGSEKPVLSLPLAPQGLFALYQSGEKKWVWVWAGYHL